MLYGQTESLSIKDYFRQKPKWLWLLIGLLILSGVLIGCFGLYQIVNANEQEIVTTTDVQSEICEQNADFGQITVYISGAVEKPGVYILNSGDRVIDLLNSAGGLSKSADKVYVNKQFNLAQRLSDSDQIYIPTKAEIEEQLKAAFKQQIAQDNQSTNTKSENFNSLISINSGTQKELMQLTGIGEVRADSIISNRPYTTLTELVSKGVLTQKLFDEIAKQIQL
jgi:competence protein ComEA